MRDNQRDAITHLGIALTSFGLLSANLFSGWQSMVVVVGMSVFLILAIWEMFFSKTLR